MKERELGDGRKVSWVSRRKRPIKRSIRDGGKI